MTIPAKHICSLIGLVLGALGFFGCAVAVVCVWSIHTQLSQTTNDVFDRIDSTLIVVRDGVKQTQARVEASKVTAQEMESTLKAWTKRESSERLTARLNLGQHVERLALALDEADHWLEMAGSSVDIVQKVLSLGNSFGVPSESEAVGILHQEIASLRLQLTEANEFVAGIRQRTTETNHEQSLQEPIQKALELSLRVVATLGSVDSRLQEFEMKLAATQTKLDALRATTLGWIFVATIGITLLALWMAAGQAALFHVARTSLRRTPGDAQ